MKPTKKTYKSDLMASVHGAAEGLAKIGVIGKTTMREFDALCLTAVRPHHGSSARAR